MQMFYLILWHTQQFRKLNCRIWNKRPMSDTNWIPLHWQWTCVFIFSYKFSYKTSVCPFYDNYTAPINWSTINQVHKKWNSHKADSTLFLWQMFVQLGDNIRWNSGDVLTMKVKKFQIEIMTPDSTQIYSNIQFLPFFYRTILVVTVKRNADMIVVGSWRDITGEDKQNSQALVFFPHWH